MAHVVDSGTAEALKAAETVEAVREQQRQEMNRRKGTALLGAEFCYNPAEAGRVLRVPDFERRLKKILPPSVFIKFDTHLNAKGEPMRAIYVRVNGELGTIAYEPGLIAERTVRAPIERKLTDPDYLITPGKKAFVIDSAPKAAETKPIIVRTDTGQVLDWGGSTWDKDTRLPGFQYWFEPGREIRRGYSGVLSALVAWGLLTADAVEKEFGAPESKLYAKALGKSVN